MIIKGHEHLTHDGARKLAARITGFWAAKGFTVSAWSEPVGKDTHSLHVYGVRSNLINGLPRDKGVKNV